MHRFNHQTGMSVAIDGADIYVEIHGSDDAPPLLFLHGGLGSVEDFNDLLQRLRGRYKMIGIDARGHGRSTLGTQVLTYARLQQDVVRVLDHLGLSAVSIVGFSDGGIVALRLASEAPAYVRKLVAVGASSELLPDTREILARVTPESWNKRFPGALGKYRSLNPAPDFDTLVRRIVPMWLDESDTGYPQAMVKRITSPTLIVRGDDDMLFTLEEGVELHGAIAGSKLFNVPMAGHVALSDQPEVCCEVLSQFLAE